jgi:ferritin-like metal-binding protein YciE
MKMRTMTDLYNCLLRDAYHAENQLIKMLPKLAKAVNEPQLKKSLDTHVLVTKVQTERLEKIFKLMNMPARGERCATMSGLLDEAQSILEKCETGVLTDAALIAIGRKIKHYEIGSYRSLIEIAKMLGLNEHIVILKEILRDEKSADAHLITLARHHIHTQVVAQ